MNSGPPKPTDAALRAWLRAEGLKLVEFSRMGGWPLPSVMRWGRTHFPTDQHKHEISVVTNGAVRPDDWFIELPQRPALGPIVLTQAQADRLAGGHEITATIRRQKVRIKLGDDALQSAIEVARQDA